MPIDTNMELIFVYVEHFRNLVDLGVNLSFDHKIRYDSSQRYISIEKDLDSLEHFFGTGVSNVSAIIGKNSVGKSNLLEVICNLIKGNIDGYHGSFVLLFKEKKSSRTVKYKASTNISGITSNINSSIDYDTKLSKKDLGVLFFSNVTDGRIIEFPKDVIDLSKNKKRHYIEREGEYLNQLKFILSEHYDTLGFDTPKELIINFGSQLPTSRFRQLVESYPRVRTNIWDYLRQNRKNRDHNFSDDFFRYLLLKVLLDFRPRSPSEFMYSKSTMEGIDEFLVAELVERYLTDRSGHEFSSPNIAIAVFMKELFSAMQNTDRKQERIGELILNIGDFVSSTHPHPTKDNSRGRASYIIDFNTSNQRHLRRFAEIFDNDFFDIEWRGVSSGQLAFLNLFAQLYSATRRISNYDDILVCIDEGDLYLHPQWQRQFLTYLLDFVSRIYRRHKVQLILTSHSPFLITDLPRQNVVLLDRRSTGECVVVGSDESLSRTFGANLYDLYEGSFFLDKGALSTFALGKIQRAIEIAEKKHLEAAELNEAREITDLIGEDLIRFKLNKILESRN